jgi:putative membrane protein
VSASRRRWPGRVYREGAEPDPRFTFANERTFLAWIRTSLALVAAGVAVEAFVGGLSDWTRKPLAAALVGLGVVTSVTAYGRWMAAERALRQNRPLPAPVLAPLLGYGVAITGVLVFTFAALSR